jgi:hypothetical protein
LGAALSRTPHRDACTSQALFCNLLEIVTVDLDQRVENRMIDVRSIGKDKFAGDCATRDHAISCLCATIHSLRAKASEVYA